MHALRPGDDQTAGPAVAAAAIIRLIVLIPDSQGPNMETRLIIAYLLFAVLALIAIAGGLVIARARRDHRRLRR